MPPAAVFCLAAAILTAPVSGDEITRTFAPSEEDFPNPERGMIYFIDLLKPRPWEFLRTRGIALAYAGVCLADWRGGPIPEEFLARLGEGFRSVRAAGIKVVLRFYYSENLGRPDAPKAVVLAHLSQLKPVLETHQDVIAVLQAGFIGAWGEWHGSTHGLDAPEHRREILKAILAALPASRSVQVRTPRFKQESVGGPLTPGEAFQPTPRARVGHHNDAFFSGPNDMGTYEEPVRTWKEWLAQDARFVPVGFETTDGPPRGTGAEFVTELELLRGSFLHWRYSDEVRRAWLEQGYDGAVRKRLGYRLVLREATWTRKAPPGGELRLSARIRNVGFAAPFNRRPVEAVLIGGGSRRAARLASVDPRRWEPGAEIALAARLALPRTLAPGVYRLALRLPDEAPSLAERAEYAIRLANEGVWDPSHGGANVLGDVRVEGEPPASGGSAEFVERR